MLVGLGGSASTDGGTGMARALGYRFLDAAGRELPEGGGPLERLRAHRRRRFRPRLAAAGGRGGSGRRQPGLVGPEGAAAVFAPQKGAGREQVARLEAGLQRLAEVVGADLGVEVATMPGGGAAGGLGAGMLAFLGAELTPGAERVIEAVGLGRRLAGAELLVTGEGRLDRQSLHGKAPVAAGRLARRAQVRSVCITGSLGDGWEDALGDAFDDVVEVPSGDDPAGRVSAAAATLMPRP